MKFLTSALLKVLPFFFVLALPHFAHRSLRVKYQRVMLLRQFNASCPSCCLRVILEPLPFLHNIFFSH